MRESPAAAHDPGVRSASPGELLGPNSARPPRQFVFERDSFAFPNELIWEYRFDAATGKTSFARREPRPDYAHRCFVLTRAARQFLYHARFDASRPAAGLDDYRRLVRIVMARSPRRRSMPEEEIAFPGHASLRDFSRAHEALLKSECGGAWRSYVLRSHWRMIFFIGRVHQARTAAGLLDAIHRHESPIIHLVRFPKLTINHGMVLFGAGETRDQIRFQAYDPNDPAKPAQLSFDRATRTFLLPANHYWAGGPLNVIEICRGWLM